MEINVFVVDDEERQRRSIVKHIAWDRYRMRVTGEWEAAEEALEGARKTPPDLLITDIRLLGTDGLELSARMRRMNPRIRIIMVTGYEEFQYAKTALDIGVDAFLVKPIIFEELNAILERVYQEEQSNVIKSKEAMRMQEQIDVCKPIAQEQLMQELIHGLIVGEEVIQARTDALDMFKGTGERVVLTIVIQAERSSTLAMEEHARLDGRQIEEAAEAACGPLLEAKTTSQRGNIVLILLDRTGVDFETATERCVRRLCAALETKAGNARIGVGPPVAKLSQLGDSFRLAQKAVNQGLLGGSERIYSWKMLKERGDEAEKSLEELAADFFEVLWAGDGQNSLSLLGEILNGFAGHRRMQGAELRSFCMHLISGAYRAASEIGDANRQYGSEQKLWERLLECREEQELLQETVHLISSLSHFIAERKKSHTQIVVQKALAYMDGHYKDNLSLRSVAESVYLSPNYLGALFRAELGISFTDQLIRIRIQKAKELLQQPELKLYEVAESVGYQNIGYFTGLFKRATGLSPKEYRDFQGDSNR